LNFLFDNNLPPAIADALHCLCKKDGHSVDHLRHRYQPSTPDNEWLTDLATDSDPWAVISGDTFRKTSAEKELFKNSGLTFFILAKSWSSHKYWDKAYTLVRWWPRIIEQAELIHGGAAFEVPYKFSGRGKFKPFFRL
jgi:hypothetical protein